MCRLVKAVIHLWMMQVVRSNVAMVAELTVEVQRLSQKNSEKPPSKPDKAELVEASVLEAGMRGEVEMAETQGQLQLIIGDVRGLLKDQGFDLPTGYKGALQAKLREYCRARYLEDSGKREVMVQRLRIWSELSRQAGEAVTQKEVSKVLTDTEDLKTKFTDPELAPHMIRKEAEDKMECESVSATGSSRPEAPPANIGVTGRASPSASPDEQNQLADAIYQFCIVGLQQKKESTQILEEMCVTGWPSHMAIVSTAANNQKKASDDDL